MYYQDFFDIKGVNKPHVKIEEKMYMISGEKAQV